MPTLTFIFLSIFGALWLLAPKIIVKPNLLPNHTYDIRIYIARFKVRIAVFAFVIYLIGWLEGEGYISDWAMIALTGGILFLSPPFLIEARGEPPGSLYNEIVMRCRGFVGQRILIATISALSSLKCGGFTTEAAIILLILNIVWTLIPTVLFTKPRWWQPGPIPLGRRLAYWVAAIVAIAALIFVGAWRCCLFIEIYLIYLLVTSTLFKKKINTN